MGVFEPGRVYEGPLDLAESLGADLLEPAPVSVDISPEPVAEDEPEHEARSPRGKLGRKN